jgi:DNA-binding MarR family transcriptional regulator
MNATRGAKRTATAKPGDAPGVVEISAALLTVGRLFTQAKAHASLCRAADVDLDRSGAALLYKLHTEGDGISLSVLAERLGIDAPAVTRKAQQLERSGLLRRERDERDARAQRILLTEEGRGQISRLLAARREWIGELLSGWTAEERLELAALLGRLSLTIEAKAPADVD